jgi:hypothetical protein
MRHTMIDRVHGWQYVTLDREEYDEAMAVGERQRSGAVRDGRRHRAGLRADRGMREHQLGCCGELVVALAEGVPWQPRFVPDRGLPDVGPWHVRTRARDDWDLPVRPDDDPDGWYLLVVFYPGQGPINRHVTPSPLTYRIVGYGRGADCQVDAFLHAYDEHRPPSYFVPQRALRPWTDRTLDVPLAGRDLDYGARFPDVEVAEVTGTIDLALDLQFPDRTVW